MGLNGNIPLYIEYRDISLILFWSSVSRISLSAYRRGDIVISRTLPWLSPRNATLGALSAIDVANTYLEWSPMVMLSWKVAVVDINYGISTTGTFTHFTHKITNFCWFFSSLKRFYLHGFLSKTGWYLKWWFCSGGSILVKNIPLVKICVNHFFNMDMSEKSGPGQHIVYRHI